MTECYKRNTTVYSSSVIFNTEYEIADYKVFRHMSEQDEICSDICQTDEICTVKLPFDSNTCGSSNGGHYQKSSEIVRCPIVIACSSFIVSAQSMPRSQADPVSMVTL